MQLIQDILNNIWFQRSFWSIIVVLLSLLLYHAVTKVLTAKEKKSSRILSDKKNKTFIRMLKSIIGTTLAVLTILTILQIFGVNVTSMLAGVGIASIVVGFALQDALKDIIRGFEIVSDSYYEIGDLIKYGDNVGQVLSVTLRTTKIQDINTMNIVSIANRNIDKVEVDQGYVYIPIPMPYELKVEQSEKIMHEIVEKLKKKEGIITAAYQGITAFDTSSLNYQVFITSDPMNRLQARRDALRIIYTTLEANKIHIPYTQLDLRNKK
ncbi:mechanosensitive ion channel family protein [Candidatus Saccharibacteria bacterium]|nr:mechanosensitive ion channel family protein [Candidatus Saccharibacteria bacterium]